LTGQGGYTVYALELHGPHANETKAHNARFKHMGYEVPYEFKSHVSVDKDTWDHIKNSGHKTAHEAGITFDHAELRQGENILARYHQPAKSADIQAVRQKVQAANIPGKKTGTQE
jgi:hypothetical protein